jgi:hypothetical protein
MTVTSGQDIKRLDGMSGGATHRGTTKNEDGENCR